MSIYIISNRSVVHNQFSTTGKEKAHRTFRVAKAWIEEGSDRASYSLLDENNLDDYRSVSRYLDTLQSEGEALTGSAALFLDLYSKMLSAKDTQSDTLFFIHGFANSLDDSLINIKDLHDTYIKPEDSGIDHLVYVAWPSLGSVYGAYWNDQNDAEETGRVLGGLFSKLHLFFTQMFEAEGRERCSNRIHLAAHSMGNTVLDYMLQNIPKQKHFPLFGEVLLLHSDVSYEIFEDEGSFKRLSGLSGRTHIYISRSDEVLGAISSYTKNFNQRLGYKGPRRTEVLEQDTFIVDTTNSGRASSLGEQILDHWGFLERDSVVSDILQVIKGVPEERIAGRSMKTGTNNSFFLS
ncbi:MAG: alpha/beta hydrolase [Fibrobacterales bacterium]